MDADGRQSRKPACSAAPGWKMLWFGGLPKRKQGSASRHFYGNRSDNCGPSVDRYVMSLSYTVGMRTRWLSV